MKNGFRDQKPYNSWQQWPEKKIKRLRSDVSKLNELDKENATKHLEWRKNLRDIYVTTALKTAKQRLITLAARPRKYNSEIESITINKPSSSAASKVYTLRRDNNQSFDQPDQP